MQLLVYYGQLYVYIAKVIFNMQGIWGRIDTLNHVAIHMIVSLEMTEILLHGN